MCGAIVLAACGVSARAELPSTTAANSTSTTAAVGGFAGGCGGGMRFTIASRISSMPIPIFALASIASSAGMASISSNWRFTEATSAFGRSILLIIGTIVSPCL